MSVTVIQKADLAASSFANDNTNAQGGVSVRVDAGSAVGNAIEQATAPLAAAIAAIPPETVTSLAVVDDQYVYTNEANVATVIEPGQFLSSDAGQSLVLGSDDRLFVNVIALLPEGSNYSGSNNGNVDISIVPDITDPNLFTIEGNLDLAGQTPTAGTNMLKEGASGFYVSTDEIVADAPDTSATVRGLVNLTDLQSLGAGRKNIDGLTVGRGNLGNANRATVTAIGTNAASATTQGDVSAIGFNAALGNTGFGLTAIGARAGVNNSGSSAVTIGVFSGQNNTGGQLVSIGFSTGQHNTGAEATSIGFAAGQVNQGAGATAVGALAGRLNRGADTTSIGRSAAFYNQGANVTAVGANAHSGATSSAHSITTSGSTGTISPAVDAALVGNRYQFVTAGAVTVYVQFTSTTAFNIVDAGGLANGTYSGTLFVGPSFSNVTVLGANASATKSNQVVLGDANVTEVFTAGNHVADNYIGRVNTSGTIDVSTAELFARTVSAATTFAFTGSVTGLVYSFVLELTNGGSATVTWPTGTKWEGGTAPTLTAAGVDILGFYTRDGGTTWRGIMLSKDSK